MIKQNLNVNHDLIQYRVEIGENAVVTSSIVWIGETLKSNQHVFSDHNRDNPSSYSIYISFYYVQFDSTLIFALFDI